MVKSKKNVFFDEDNSMQNLKGFPSSHKKRSMQKRPSNNLEDPYVENEQYVPYTHNPHKMNENITSIRSKKNFNRQSKSKKSSILNTENQFFSNLNNTVPSNEQSMKKNSSMKYFPKLYENQERLTAPNRVNPISNIYKPKTEAFFPNSNLPPGAEIVFISKKDQQVYKLHKMGGNEKDVLVNVRDRSVKGLKKIASVKSIQGRNSRKKPGRRVPKKGGEHTYSNSVYDNFIGVMTSGNVKNTKSRKGSKLNQVTDQGVIKLPNQYTMPQKIFSSHTEFSDQVRKSLIGLCFPESVG
jgi:hypothetical protein